VLHDIIDVADVATKSEWVKDEFVSRLIPVAEGLLALKIRTVKEYTYSGRYSSSDRAN